ncbi:MAG TPA: NADPH:quinone oxidoreductase family protein [Candidatus Limnocylindrales bacterium]|nr:NADPH:quinone oxidoreductase family protein [Candidatus Limnocylindrales bacterium]
MRAIQLNGLEGPENMRLVDIKRPKPAPNEVLIEVKAAGVNYAEVEQTWGRYPLPRPLPIIMGFEAAGVVVDCGSRVERLKIGDRVTGVVSSGGYAEYATADASLTMPIPDGISFAEASTIPIQGLSAYTLLKLAAKPLPDETLLIQAAAGGVGLYLVQLAKIMGVKRVIALASSPRKLELVRRLGADVVIDYSHSTWPDQVMQATGGKGVDVVLEMASGKIGDASFNLIAPFGRVVFYGAKNYHDTISTVKMQQLSFKNQSLIGYAFPTLRPEQIKECVQPLLDLISQKKIKLVAANSFPLVRAEAALAALSSRQTVGKVVLIP